MQYLRVINFEKFQHYKDRHPTWIKLYRDLWSDQRFTRLTEFERYCLVSFFMIASQNNNQIPFDDKWLRGEVRTVKKLPIDSLVLAGWIEWTEQNASTVLSTRADGCAPARSRELEEKEKEPLKSPAGTFAYSAEFEEFWALYPRAEGKGAAWRVWKRIKPDGELREKMRVAIAWQATSEQWTKEHGKYIPHFATWLNKARWDDRIPSHQPPNGFRPKGVVL